MDRCERCAYVYDEVPLSETPGRLRSLSVRLVDALGLAEREGLLRRRPAPETWSALEYGCHVRDVMRVQLERLQLALSEPIPNFAPMDRDQRAVDERYNEQDDEVVAAELVADTDRLAAALETLSDEDWRRTGIYNFPAPAERSMAWLARHTVHEALHHLDDIGRGLERLRS